jgi:hypothetical protein
MGLRVLGPPVAPLLLNNGRSPARNYVSLNSLSRLCDLTAVLLCSIYETKIEDEQNTNLISCCTMDEGRMRAIGIMAAILASLMS